MCYGVNACNLAFIRYGSSILRLQNQSHRVRYIAHRIISVVISCIATLQVSALLLRPKKEHKYWFYWYIYHHCIRYSVVVLRIVGIFEGYWFLNPQVYTCFGILKRKKSISTQKMPHGVNGTNGNNGYGDRIWRR